MSSILVDEGELAQMTAEHYLTVRKLAECQRELAEARAALRKIEEWSPTACKKLAIWDKAFAEALNAAREV
jgi:hypothetical protein